MKRIKKNIIFLLFLSSLMIFTQSQYVIVCDRYNDEMNDKTTYFVHSAGSWNLTGTKIYIDELDLTCDWENITAEYDWCTGNGTIDNPYIIQDVELNGLGSGTCVEIRNSRKFFVIENCSLSNAEIGIKIENCSNFGINENKISNMKGTDGLDNLLGSPGTDGGDGKMSSGISINNCINFNNFLNEIMNIIGGKGGLGANGGNEAASNGIIVNNSRLISINYNNISNVVGGQGGNGIGGDIDYFYGGNGGNGGQSSGICISNSTDAIIEHNFLNNMEGGEGGIGGSAGFNLVYDEIGSCGDGGLGGRCMGIYLENCVNIINKLNQIIEINGGNGGNGASATLIEYHMSLGYMTIIIEIPPGYGGYGGGWLGVSDPNYVYITGECS